MPSVFLSVLLSHAFCFPIGVLITCLLSSYQNSHHMPSVCYPTHPVHIAFAAAKTDVPCLSASYFFSSTSNFSGNCTHCATRCARQRGSLFCLICLLFLIPKRLFWFRDVMLHWTWAATPVMLWTSLTGGNWLASRVPDACWLSTRISHYYCYATLKK